MMRVDGVLSGCAWVPHTNGLAVAGTRGGAVLPGVFEGGGAVLELAGRVDAARLAHLENRCASFFADVGRGWPGSGPPGSCRARRRAGTAPAAAGASSRPSEVGRRRGALPHDRTVRSRRRAGAGRRGPAVLGAGRLP
jgi:hypothetical protein